MLSWIRRKLWAFRPYRCRTCSFATRAEAAARAHDGHGHQVIKFSNNSYRVLSEGA